MRHFIEEEKKFWFVHFLSGGDNRKSTDRVYRNSSVMLIKWKISLHFVDFNVFLCID